MDPFTNKQAEIAAERQALLDGYPQIWSKITSEYKQPGQDNRVWLTYSANYLFRTGGVRWALDPLTPYGRMGLSSPAGVGAGLENLQFVLLTHRHADHLDLGLISSLRDAPIQWVVPDFLQEEVMRGTGLRREKILTPRPGEEIPLAGMRILPFNGSHWETRADGSPKGLPALGYRVICREQCWLFPGDTRTYDVNLLSAFDAVDAEFAHVWLGRAAAMLENPPLLEDFCRFQLSFQPKRIILTHLKEVGRDADEYWDERHVNQVSKQFQALQNMVQVEAAYIGQSINFSKARI